METGEELELGPPPLNIKLEEAGQQVLWGPVIEPVEEGSSLAPLGPRPMEVDGTEQALGDVTAAGEATDKETNSLLAHASPSCAGQLWAGLLFAGGWSPVGGHVGVGGLEPWCKTDRLTFEVGLCLDLSFIAPRPKKPLGLGLVACPALESHLWPTFRTTLPLNVLGCCKGRCLMQTGQ